MCIGSSKRRLAAFARKTTSLGNVLGLLGALAVSGAAQAQDTIRIGILAALEGPFSALGQDAMRGAELALSAHGGQAGGKRVELVRGASNGSPESALATAQRLVDEQGASILVGPLSGGEGVALMDFIRKRPKVTFLNGTSGAQETTLVDPAPNFFRFSTDGAQWSAGLGNHAWAKGYRKVAVVAEDYAFPYAQVAGFMMEFCKAGGRVVGKHWVPIGTKDYGAVIAKLPPDVDAVYVALGGTDAVNFLTQYDQKGGAKPLIAGSIAIDQSVLGNRGKLRDLLVGTPSSGPIADSLYTSAWLKFVDDYRRQFKGALASPSLFAHGYYVNTKAVLEAIEATRGDLSNDHAALRKRLATMTLHTPTGEVRLDQNRNAVANIYLTEIARVGDGSLINKVVKVIPSVDQRLGLSTAEFQRVGLGSRSKPECP